MGGRIPEPPPGQPPDNKGLSTGAIVAIVIVALILLVFGLCVAALGSLEGGDDESDDVESVAFGVVDGRTVLAYGGWDGARLWDPVTGTQIGKPWKGRFWLTSVAFGVVDGRTVLASGAFGGKMRLWDPATGTQIGEPWTGHNDGVQSVAFGVVEGRTCWPPPAGMGRCGCGIRPPGSRSGSR